MNQSQPLPKMEAEVNINLYHENIDTLNVKLNHWLQQLEVNFSVHQIEKEQRFHL